MNGISHYRDAIAARESISDEVIRQVVNPKPASDHARANAAQAAVSLEADRQAILIDVRTERLLRLLERCLPYVKDARQGRGDKDLEKLINEELQTW